MVDIPLCRHGKFLGIGVVIILLLASILVLIYSQQHERQGIGIVFVDEKDSIIKDRVIGVQIRAIKPSEVSIVEIYRGIVKEEGKLILNPKNIVKFNEVLKEWINTHKHDKSLQTALLVDIWVVDGDKIMYYPTVAIPYSPFKVCGQFMWKVIKLSLSITSSSTSALKPLYVRKVKKQALDGNTGTVCIPYWVKVNGYSWETNYIKVPVLMIHNQHGMSGLIIASLSLTTNYITGFKLTVAYGYSIVKKIYEEQSSNVSLDVYTADFTRSGNYYMDIVIVVLPKTIEWIWVKAKLAHYTYREYDPCNGYTGYEKIEELVIDVSIESDGEAIEHGTESGEPPYTDKLFNGTIEEQLIIPDTVLSDGVLDANETISLRKIIKWFDKYDQNFEIGLPIGAIIATLHPIATPLAGLTVSLSMDTSSKISIFGAIKNAGSLGGTVSKTYNVPVPIFVRISKFKYSTGDHTFNVPVGIWFRCG